MPYKSNDNAKEAAKKRMQRYRNKGATRPVTPSNVTPKLTNVTPDVTPCKNCIILQGQINKLKTVVAASKGKVTPDAGIPKLCRHKLSYCRICN